MTYRNNDATAGAYAFKGVDTYLEIENPLESPETFDTSMDDFTLSLWMKTDNENAFTRVDQTYDWQEGKPLIAGQASYVQNEFGLTFGERKVMFGTGGSSPTTLTYDYMKPVKWRTVTRDLQADIDDLTSDVTVRRVCRFMVRGSGRIDDVYLLSDLTDDTPAVYTNGESINGWTGIDASETVRSVYDDALDSNVIELTGNGKKSEYRLLSNDGSLWNNISDFIIQWKMKYSEPYKIYVVFKDSSDDVCGNEESPHYAITYLPGDARSMGSPDDWDYYYPAYGLGNDTYTEEGDQWINITATRNATNGELRLYIDGREEASTDTGLTGPLDVPSILSIGGRDYDRFFKGSIDELRIYNTVLDVTGDGSQDLSRIQKLWSGPLNLEAYYPFDDVIDGSADDFSGNGWHGTVTNASQQPPSPAIPSRPGAKEGNKFYDFDGSSSYIQSDLNIDLSAMPVTTICAWVYPADDEEYNAIFSNLEGNNLYGRSLTFMNQSGNYSVWYDGGHHDTGFGVSLNAWQHTCAGFNNGTVIFYKNGIESPNGLSTESPDNFGVSDFYIGVQAFDPETDPSYKFNGKIDDVQVYDRILTEKEIRNLAWDFDIGDGLVAYYPFNGNADDESGNGHDGTVSGALLSVGKDNVPNSAYSFDGVDDYIEILQHTDLEPTNDISYGFWAQTSDWSNCGGADLRMLSKKNGNGYDLRCDDKKIEGNIDISGEGNVQKVDTDNNWDTSGSWHHFMVTYSSTTGDIKLYVDGNLEETDTNTPSTLLHTANKNLLIGARPATTYDYFFNGKIDQVRIYNRVLQAAEVEYLYHTDQ